MATENTNNKTRYKVYLGNFEKKIFESNNKKEATLIYVKALQKMMDEQEYPIFIYDSETKEKIK